jgi:phosphate transport system protein
MTHLQRELDKLKRKILGLGALVEDSLRLAFQAIEQRDAAKARRVIETDILIDQNEVEIEEECLKILALYQPVAGDLRFVAAVIKINSELERIGDLAENIAKRALQLLDEQLVAPPHTVAVMADRTGTILERALDALVRQDAVTAREVLVADQEIDELYRLLLDELKALLRESLERLDAIVLLFSVARYLERLADHATNIAEDVLYMVEGEIQRHVPAPVAPGTMAELLRLGDEDPDDELRRDAD